MELLKLITDFIKKFWNKLVKIFVAIVNFFRHIIDWFKAKYEAIIKKRPKAIPIALKIKDNIQTGNYNTYNIGLKKDKHIVKTFYDQDNEEILIDDTEVISFEELDDETKKQFGDKEMLILE